MAIISLRQLLDHAAQHDYGVRKVNIDTDRRMAMTGQFNTAGQASKIKIIPLLQMAERYKSGEFEPQTDQGQLAAA